MTSIIPEEVRECIKSHVDTLIPVSSSVSSSVSPPPLPLHLRVRAGLSPDSSGSGDSGTELAQSQCSSSGSSARSSTSSIIMGSATSPLGSRVELHPMPSHQPTATELMAERMQLPLSAFHIQIPERRRDSISATASSLTSSPHQLQRPPTRGSGCSTATSGQSVDLSVKPGTPQGSPHSTSSLEMSEEQLAHIASLVRKRKKGSRRSRATMRAPPPSATAAAARMHASPSTSSKSPAAGPLSTDSSHGSDGSNSTTAQASYSTRSLGAPSISPATKPMRSPQQSPSVAFGSSPRNLNVFKLKLPSAGMAPSAGSPLGAVLSGDESTREACSSESPPPRSDDGRSDSESEDDFASVATPGNAGLGAEEDGEIILCGVHYNGFGSRGNSGAHDTTDESEGEVTPMDRSTNTIFSLETISETRGAKVAPADSMNDMSKELPALLPTAVTITEVHNPAATPVSLSHRASMVPAFGSSLDTSKVDRQPMLHASAAQNFAEQHSQCHTPNVSTPSHASQRNCGSTSPRLGPIVGQQGKVRSRRASLPALDGELIAGHAAAAAAAAAAASRTQKSRGVPYDFSPSGHLIIDGFEISRRGVARTPEVTGRRFSVGGTISCGNSPRVGGRSLLAPLSGNTAPSASLSSTDPMTSLQLMGTSTATTVINTGSSMLMPRRLLQLPSTASEPNSLCNTPTLLGRRLSLVKLQREGSREAADAGSRSASPFFPMLPASVTASGNNSGQLGPTDSPLPSMLPDLTLDSFLDVDLKSAFGPAFRQPKAASLGIELRLSDLVKLGEIGRGVTGAVHKAIHLPTLRIVALKSVSIFDKDERHQFLQELRAFLQVESEHMVKFVGACFSEGMITMALEYLNRGSLDLMVARSGPLAEGALKIVAQQLLLGIHDLHSQHFIHRDIKPANFLVNNEGRCVVSDFGLLKRLEFEASSTKDGAKVKECNNFVGTMLYLAPERIAGLSFSFPSDIYAVGLSVIFLATGGLGNQVPKDYWGLVSWAANRDAAPPGLPADEEGRRFSPLMRDFVAKMMVKDPSTRWTAEQLLEHEWFRVEDQPSEHAELDNIDPLEHWPGRQLLNPPAEELCTLMDAVIGRWYPMPTLESLAASGGVPPRFEPSTFDLTRFAHLATQLGWEVRPVVQAFTDRIQARMDATIASFGVASSSGLPAGRVNPMERSTSTPVVSMSQSSSVMGSNASLFPAPLSVPSPVSSASASLDHVSAPLPLMTAVPFSLPLHTSPRMCVSRGNSAGTSNQLPPFTGSSLSTSPFSPQCLSPSQALTSPSHALTGQSLTSPSHSLSPASKPPLAPLRAHSPLELPPTTGSEGQSTPSRIVSRRLSASARRVSFQMRMDSACSVPIAPPLHGASPTSAVVPIPLSQPSSSSSSPSHAPRSLGLRGAGEALAAAIALPRIQNRGMSEGAHGT